MSSNLDDFQVESTEICVTDLELSPNIINSSIEPRATHTGTQHYYYRGSDKESLYITAQWSYGDGYYRYSPYLQDIGCTYTQGRYPYYVPYDSTYSITNSAKEMACTFYCDRFISDGITNITAYTIPVTFTAGGGDIWGSSYT